MVILLEGCPHYISWITKNCSSCYVSHNKRIGGKSAYTYKKLLSHTFNILFTFSNLPIRFLSLLSILVLFVVVLYSIYIIIRKFYFNDFVAGYPSLIIAIGISLGLILMALSIIGEYLYRINLKTTKKPNYQIDEVL